MLKRAEAEIWLSKQGQCPRGFRTPIAIYEKAEYMRSEFGLSGEQIAKLISVSDWAHGVSLNYQAVLETCQRAANKITPKGQDHGSR